MASNKSTCILYASFDPDGLIDPHVEYQINCLKEFATEIIFVTTAELRYGEANKIEDDHCRVIQRENVGIDFLSWRRGLWELRAKAQSCHRIICMNDSCYGPWNSLGPLFDELDRSNAQVIGATQSFEIAHHVQSFFIAYQNGIERLGLLDEFYEGIEPADKFEMIKRYEVGQMKWFEDRGVSVQSVNPLMRVPVKDSLTAALKHLVRLQLVRAMRHLNRAFNPMEGNPMVLSPLTIMNRFPFVKVELLRRNPLRNDLAPIYSKVRAANPELFALVENHLARTGPHSARAKFGFRKTGAKP